MIVMAVTGALFIGAMVLITGRQNKTQFAHAVRDAQSQVQQSYNEVSAGYYTGDDQMKCQAGPLGTVLTDAGGKGPGTNRDCLFLGKVLQFAVQGTDPQEFNVYTVAGLRNSTSGPLNLITAKPRLIAKGASEGASTIPDHLYERKKLLNGLEVVAMYYDNNPANDIGAVGFMSNIASLGSPDGSQRVEIVALPGTFRDQTKDVAVDQINAVLDTGAGQVNPPGGVQICLRGGTADQSALMTVGAEGRANAVEVEIKNGGSC